MRTILTATAIAALMASPGAAQVVVPETEIEFEVPTELDYDGYGMTEFDVESQDLDDEAVWSSVTNERIGNVNDVVMGADGERYIAASIGGFLNIGDKDILLPMDEVGVYVNTEDDDVRVYVNATEEQLEAYPEFEE